MPQRNAQNPIKIGKTFGSAGSVSESGLKGPKPASASGGGHCPKCGTLVPSKPGFRFSSLTCAKCGTAMGQK